MTKVWEKDRVTANEATTIMERMRFITKCGWVGDGNMGVRRRPGSLKGPFYSGDVRFFWLEIKVDPHLTEQGGPEDRPVVWRLRGLFRYCCRFTMTTGSPILPQQVKAQFFPRVRHLCCLPCILLLPKDMRDSDPTTLLTRAQEGVEGATEDLIPLIYDELHALAGRHLRFERPDHTLTPTALINEAFLKLTDQTQVGWRDRQHFFALSSKVMRQILVDHARRRKARKRGGAARPVPLDNLDVADPDRSEQILALDESLTLLEKYDPSLAQLVHLRFFAGLSMEEASTTLQVSKRTAERMWTRARAFLLDDMGQEDE